MKDENDSQYAMLPPPTLPRTRGRGVLLLPRLRGRLGGGQLRDTTIILNLTEA